MRQKSNRYQKTELYTAIQDCIPFISDTWKKQYGDFLADEHIAVFAQRIVYYLQEGTTDVPSLPHFDEELTPNISTILTDFTPILTEATTSPQQWAQLIETTPFKYLLVLIGQRWTAASVKDEKAIPPLTDTLLKSCFIPINPQICIATRAWEKHIGRSTDNFWGVLKGNAALKEQKAKELIISMLRDKTWWNTFYHYKHQLIYEIRVPSGHGIRWNATGTQLIGFLEPFLETSSY